MNFCLDYVVLFTTASILKIKTTAFRRTLSSLFGSFFALICEVVSPSPLLRIALAVLFLPILCYACFGKRKKGVHIRINCVAYLVSFVICGINVVMESVWHYCSSVKFARVMLFALVLFASACFSCVLYRSLLVNAKGRSVSVLIESGGNEYEYRLLCDSGNRLFDPYARLPVIVMKESQRTCLSVNALPRFIMLETALGKSIVPTITPGNVFVLKGKRKIRVSAAVCFVKDENLNFSYDGVFPQSLAENL